MTSLEQINSSEASEVPTILEEYKVPILYSLLQVVEYLLLAAAIGSFLFLLALPDKQKAVTYIAIFISTFVFIFLINKQLRSDFQINLSRADILTKSEIQSSMLETAEGSSKNILAVARTRALKYCQELITDYKKTRRNSRNIYYISQILTIILSGITPILVVVERLDSGPIWFKWLPVIFPALAAIVSSIVTSFPFQENWIEANKTVELLEAEQEKFILGISKAYRCYDVNDPVQRQNKAKKGIENFITQVNNIHLKQIQELAVEKAEAETATENPSASSAT